MYIIDRNKDYYDYYSHIYGIDKKVIFDRRGSVKMTDDILIQKSVLYRNISRAFLILEVGFIQYIIVVSNIKDSSINIYGEYTPYTGDFNIVKENKEYKHFYKTPLSIRGALLDYKFDWNGYKTVRKYNFDDRFENLVDRTYHEENNPILAGTSITSLIDPDTIWKELQNYISSLDNDKDISIPSTDDERAEMHGFDRKTSFRHRKK